MNTSFSGPGAPIVETAEDAFAAAAKPSLGYFLTRLRVARGPATL
ncbi:MAG: hypothetical protein Q7T23_15940 [Phenylobacterium sp.]|nr:hypothetical protein [Phenylobacterium sp.]